MEDTVERIVSHFRYAAQGLEERKQILYLLGPVGGGKSSLAERLKLLMEREPIYVLKAGDEISPLFESPLGLFDPERMGDLFEDKYGVARRRLTGLISPWATKRLDEFGGDISKFTVVKLLPSKLRQICIAKTEPGDENNQDISSLVGKVDIRQLEHFSQSDPDAYSFFGGPQPDHPGAARVRRDVQGADQGAASPADRDPGGQLPGHGELRRVPLSRHRTGPRQRGRVAAVQEQQEQRGLPRPDLGDQGALLPARVPKSGGIYEKLLRDSELGDAPCASEVLEILSRFCVATRLREHENSNLYSKMRVYDGENLKDTDPKAKSVQEYRDAAGLDEGMNGVSTRFAFKVLSETFNYDTDEIAADPVHLLYVLELAVRREQYPGEAESSYLEFIKQELAPRYAEFIGHEIQKAYLESYTQYGQNLFDRYIAYADAWIEEHDFKDPDTGQVFDREVLDAELSKIEKPAGIANPKDFRNEVVKFALRARAKHEGMNPSWTSYEKLREVIEKRMFSQVEELLPVISFGTKKDSVTDKQHGEFVERMAERGYTERQVRRLVEWYMRLNKAG